MAEIGQPGRSTPVRPASEVVAKVDPDRLAHLEEERDFLLRSLDDLDREFGAGDVDEVDYHELREGYVARAASVLHQIESAEAGFAELAAAPRRRGRALIWLGAVVVFAAVAGILLANASGFRGTGTTLTGSGGSVDEQLADCRGQLVKDAKKSVACFDKLLSAEPDNAEALTYEGWAKVQAGDVAGGSAAFDRVVALDPTYPDVHVFRAAVHKNAGEFTAAQAEIDRLYALNPPAIVVQVMQQMGLDSAVAEGLLPPDTKACWTTTQAAIVAAASLDSVDPSTSEDDAAKQRRVRVAADLATSLQCLDAVVASRSDASALEMRGLGLLALAFAVPGQDGVLERARQSLDTAVSLAPDDPTPHLIRGSIAGVQGDTATAKADLAAAGKGRLSPLFSKFLSVDDLRNAVESDAASALTTTTTHG